MVDDAAPVGIQRTVQTGSAECRTASAGCRQRATAPAVAEQAADPRTFAPRRRQTRRSRPPTVLDRPRHPRTGDGRSPPGNFHAVEADKASPSDGSIANAFSRAFPSASCISRVSPPDGLAVQQRADAFEGGAFGQRFHGVSADDQSSRAPSTSLRAVLTTTPSSPLPWCAQLPGGFRHFSRLDKFLEPVHSATLFRRTEHLAERAPARREHDRNGGNIENFPPAPDTRDLRAREARDFRRCAGRSAIAVDPVGAVGAGAAASRDRRV